MAVSIRLSRQGSKKKPFYRVVAADRRSPRDGRFIELLGFFDPKKKTFQLDPERYQHWVQNGAIVSDTLKTLVRKQAQQAQAAAQGTAKK
jgi:small subunit ribosomal protein S16